MPNCKIHQKEMRLGKFGNYFCPTPVGKNPNTGKTIFCDYKVEPGQEELVSENIGMGKVPESATGIKNKLDIPSEDPKARGMVRHGVACAFIEKMALPKLTPEAISLMEDWVEYIMEGPLPIAQHLKERAEIEKTDKDLDEIFKNG